ncbi:Kinesin-like protein kif24 [Physocladia obscura]|uniref:Kinesin-like protein n=1 Tax=Physocladia obscura TaxID=109957 RepID=A0AAD5T9Y4_9FUNG|nr:Kinesin-like protein kif24 [Physocladia obscura]
MSIFETTLRTAGLDHYHENFAAFGIDSLQSLTLLTMQVFSSWFPDYGVVGVNSMEDRKRNFRVLNIISARPHLKSESDLNNPSPVQPPPPSTLHRPGVSFLPKPASVSNNSVAATVAKSNPASSNSAIPEPNLHKMASQRFNLQRMASPKRETSLRDESRFNSNSAADLTPRPQTADSDDSDSDEGMKIKYSFNNLHNPKAPKPLLNVYGVPTNLSKGNNTGPVKVADLNDRIRVCVRKRPLNKKEIKSSQTDVATVLDRRTLVVNEPKVKVDLTKFVEQHEFTFDEVFDVEATNDEVPGQTGSGKTYTMLDETNGLYVKAGRDIFKLLEKPEYSHLTAYVGFYEIYQSQLYDLLNGRKKLHAREDGKQNVVISGLQEYEINSVDKVVQIFNHGHNARSTGATGANADSSRSHAIFQIVLKHRKSKKKVQGKLSFIDLAGSERGADRGETDQRTRMEGSEINKSLLALKECIRALDQDSKHTPFRQSKLTQVLKDSFIGNSRTCMIANISPGSGSTEHSLNTLRYAYRVKELKGDVQYQDEEEVRDGLYEEPEIDDIDAEEHESTDDDPLLLDTELPDNLLDSDDGGLVSGDESDNNIGGSVPTLSKLSLNNAPKQRPQLTNFSSKLKSISKVADSSPAGSTTSSVVSKSQSSENPGFEELLNSHRQHLRLFAELSKVESKLIVNYSMKTKPDLASGMSQEAYLTELEMILTQKEASINEMKKQVQLCKGRK